LQRVAATRASRRNEHYGVRPPVLTRQHLCDPTGNWEGRAWTDCSCVCVFNDVVAARTFFYAVATTPKRKYPSISFIAADLQRRKDAAYGNAHPANSLLAWQAEGVSVLNRKTQSNPPALPIKSACLRHVGYTPASARLARSARPGCSVCGPSSADARVCARSG
jgi:hypothetical protein